MKKTALFFLLFSILPLLKAHSTIITNVAEQATSSTNKSNSPIVGIWQNEKNSDYCYEFTSTGEYIRYKIKRHRNSVVKVYGIYYIERNHKLHIEWPQEESSYQIHFDNNNAKLIILSDDETAVCNRISRKKLNELLKGLK